MIIIQTRQNRQGNWWCNVTVDGYDYSFEGETLAHAQGQMKDLLDERGTPVDKRKWEEPELYQEKEEAPNADNYYRSWRIDTDMV